MNICIITSSFPSCSGDTVQAPFLLDFIKGLKKRGHRIFVFTQDRYGEKEEFLEGVKINWFPWVKSGKPLVQLNPLMPSDLYRIANLFYKGRRTLPAFVRENGIDGCLALWVLPGGFFANHAFRKTGIPYSVWSLGSDIFRYGRNPFLYPMMRRIIREARGVFADGFDLSKRIEEQFGRKCFFLATTRALPSSSPSLIPPPSSRNKFYHFLFVGRIEKVKGVDLLLESMACLKEEAPDVRLTVVGSGGMEEWARSFIETRDLGGQVSWMGNVSDQTLFSLYESCDCVVIPSRSESIPLVFSEALRFHKDLIVTDVGDMGMLGRQYGVATVVPPESGRALEEAMKEKAGLKNYVNQETSEVGRQELIKLFNIETSVERFLADYSENEVNGES